ncbi:nucleotide pyrophosphohydrolase [Mycobacterium phage Journey13]|nr:nucleotide pyrophosphohydrolase [Mycobacterium phage Journey13]
MSTFTKYQLATNETAVYPGAGDSSSIEALAYVTLGLVGEAGEIANKVKKIIRDQDGVITPENRVQLEDELGDVLWYVARLATQIDTPLSMVAELNLAKLRDRKVRGVLQGSGDNR